MQVGPGSHVGSLKIVSLIGSGGMGEVYLAQDVRLGRDVAVKILPETLADDPGRRNRFEREARMLASLNHPNIATLYGLTDIGRHIALEMEFVPGDTLADRLRRGPIRVEDALPIFKQLAQALEAAHERGIVHRDLKPANIKVPADGRVKVLDFGLAKAMDAESSDDGRPDAAFTVTSSHTQPGMILGTARYMSPEQARGLPVDRRSDIWSFGCVVYETLCGAPPFMADTASDTLAAILKDEPDWSVVAGPPPLQRLLRRCLQKDPQSRLRDIADARLEIEELLLETSASRPVASRTWPAKMRRWHVRALMGGLLALVATVITIGLWWSWPRPALPAPARVAILLPPGHRLVMGSAPVLALSPDGQRLVYAAATPGRLTALYLRPLDRFEASPLPGTEAASAPFFSPDGRWVGFYASDGIQRVSLDGGAPLRICAAPPISGAAWLTDGTIVFGTTLAGDGLWRVSADGGTAEPLTTPERAQGEIQHRYPLALPDSTIAFTVVTDNGAVGAVLPPGARTWGKLPQVQPAGGIQWASGGHLVTSQGMSLLAIPFDMTTGDVSGSPVPLSERTIATAGDGTPFAVAQSGTLAYVPGRTAAPSRALMLVDRDGRATPLGVTPGAFVHPRFSPDNRWLAVTIETDTGSDVWLQDQARSTRSRLTAGDRSGFAVWSPDSGAVGFHATRLGPWTLYARPVDGSTPAESLVAGARPEASAVWSRDPSETLLPGFVPSLTGANPLFPQSWHADGRTIAFVERKPNGEHDIWVVERGRDPAPFLLTPADESSPEFSPDGRWLAYVSDESGRNEVYVQPYPGPGGRWLASTAGGTDPVWSPDGREMYYLQGDQMMAVPFVTTPAPSPGVPRRLFEGAYERSAVGRNYDLSPDGTRFVMIRGDQADRPPQIHVVLNWASEIAARKGSR